jgi:hypothetical protein
MAAATVITLKRGDQYVEDRESGELAHGLVGELWVHGLCFDAIERMDGYVALDGGQDYPWSSMYWHKRLGCYVVNPWHKKKNKAGEHAQILIHKATVPSHLEGCIAPGIFDGSKLTLSREAMEVIWEQCGGKPGFKAEKPPLVVTLRVEGSMRPLAQCTPYAG